ncbi:c-type cytochrome biogenesis protein CcsB [Ectothiorhodospira mobilis]|uniref:c-type cytochrome biogenesis protein CcsB n=1 Tax=Ectothiorhodospira mobilis TaxID=195064 RepID=UPI001EE7C036|nr:c-type cytochrome biogenesis protein CcsB [Ectothiorhodospira mobilis]MCG5536695.1 c-type cytochrome biogenesis protein CcsB [Ectothiorhodospira mobilis]
MSVPHDTLAVRRPGFLRRLSLADWLWAVLVLVSGGVTLALFGDWMNIYQILTLVVHVGVAVWLGWYWRAFRPFALSVALMSLLGVLAYGDDLANAESNFFLEYLLSGQSAVMWMCALLFMSTAAYMAHMFRRGEGGEGLAASLAVGGGTAVVGAGLLWLGSAGIVPGMQWVAPLFLIIATGALAGPLVRTEFTAHVGGALAWAAAAFGLSGLFVRWRETYLHDPTWGYIPVSNLWEVFVLFCIITVLMYLYYEGRTRNRGMGAFVLLLVSAAVAFLLYYTLDQQAHQVQPLVPALQSWWMKVHVPANFIGYGGFAIAAMLGIAYILRDWGERRRPGSLLARRLPGRQLLDDTMYKSVAVGFAFFTIATVLGAMWAAEAWGGYWSWDPKEVWALIVWLNYAAWLHMRFTKGWRGTPMAWWSVIGLFLTTFAFVGVNMFLGGLHSYGEL